MATRNKKTGGWVIQFTGVSDVGGERKKRRFTLRFGKLSADAIRSIEGYVDQLNAARIAGQAVSPQVARWVSEQNDEIRKKLEKVELVEKKCEPAAKVIVGIKPFIDEYKRKRVDVKVSTRSIWDMTSADLCDFYGADRDITTISEGEAEDFKQHLLRKKLASMTIHKRLQVARQFFQSAVKHRLISVNPFEEVKITAVRQRPFYFVDTEQVKAILGVCNPKWRAIVVLSRYGGLRCPTEVFSLRWQDINWDAGRMLVTSPKTAHLPGHDCRSMPLFAEVRETLTDYFELAEPGATYLFPEERRRIGTGNWRDCNLRTQFCKIIRRAGLKPWPGAFHAMRSSRQTELEREIRSRQAVCEWLGNTPEVAGKHYVQVTDADFKAASALQSALQSVRPVAVRKGAQETPGREAVEQMA